jgi:hypothetical protein
VEEPGQRAGLTPLDRVLRDAVQASGRLVASVTSTSVSVASLPSIFSATSRAVSGFTDCFSSWWAAVRAPCPLFGSKDGGVVRFVTTGDRFCALAWRTPATPLWSSFDPARPVRFPDDTGNGYQSNAIRHDQRVPEGGQEITTVPDLFAAAEAAVGLQPRGIDARGARLLDPSVNRPRSLLGD